MIKKLIIMVILICPIINALDVKITPYIDVINIDKNNDYVKILVDSERLNIAKENDLRVVKTNYFGDVDVGLYEKYNYGESIIDYTYDCDCRLVKEFNNNTSLYTNVNICSSCTSYKSIQKEDIRKLNVGYELIGEKEIFEIAKPTKLEYMGNGWGYSVWTDVFIFDNKIEGATWWNETYGKKRQINITSSENKDYFQTRIYINTTPLYESGLIENNCSDILFTNSTGYILPHFTERCVINDNSTESIFTILTPLILGTISIDMYYNNSDALDFSSYEDVYGNYILTIANFNGNANDILGNNNGTVVGADLTTDRSGYENSAYDFIDANNDYITFPSGMIGSIGSIAMWFKVDDWANDAMIFDNTKYGVSDYMHLRANAPSSNYFAKLSDDTYTDTTTSRDTINWYHTVFTWNSSSGWQYWINGSLVNNDTSHEDPTNSYKFGLGVSLNGDARGNDFDFDGKIDDFRVYQGIALTESDISRFYISLEPTYVIGVEEKNDYIMNFLQYKSIDINENSTGNIIITFNASDLDGISKCWFAKTLNNTVDNTYFWSVRYPENNKTDDYDYPTLGKVLRADNRNENRDFESYSNLTENNYYKWAILGNDSDRLNIYGNNTFWTINYTSNVFDTAFQNNWIIDRTIMQETGYLMQEITKAEPIMIKGVNLLEYENRSTSGFAYINFTGTPIGTLDIWYCNSSYSSGTRYDLSPNCAFFGGLNYEDINYTYEVSNSKYIRFPVGVEDNEISGIITTREFYVVIVRSASPIGQGSFYIGYSTNDTDTNLSFTETETMFRSVNSGVDWSDTYKSPNVWFSSVQEGLIFEYKVYCVDNDNNEYSSEIYNDTIGLSHFPPTGSVVYAINGDTDWDEYIISGNMTISVLTGVSNWDYNLTYNISLYNGLNYYLVNDSFYDGGMYVNLTVDSLSYNDDEYLFYTCSIDGDGDYTCIMSGRSIIIDNFPFILNTNKREIIFPTREVITI